MSCLGAPAGEGLVRIGERPPRLEPPARESAGMSLRKANFGLGVDFYAPGLRRWQTAEWKPERSHRFVAVSVTGDACALQCDHCQSKVLEGMIAVGRERTLFQAAQQLQAQGAEGILVSGGSAKSGGVPLAAHVADLRRIREELGLRVLVHSGVVDAKLADALARARVEGVMIDVMGADETIRDVYHLDLTVADFDRSLALLADRGLTLLPHIVLGLHYGRFLGEHRALEMIRRYPVSALILVVLTPLPGTPMAHLPPPPVDQVEAFFADARAALPRTGVNLGCGRPLGATKVALDKAAVDQGLNGIAYPADGIIEYATASGLEPRYYEACCSLTWAPA